MTPPTPIAENRIRISRSLFNEGMRAVETGEYSKSIQRLILVLAVIFAAAAAWLLSVGGSLIFLLGECIFLGALLFWLVVMLPNTRRRSKYKAMMNVSNDIPERTVTFYPDYLIVKSDGGKETVIQYGDIVNWKETKNLYILNCQNHVSVLLDKNGFVIGVFDTVRSLCFSDS